MRIAIVPPLFEPIPPRKYGGTERVVHNLVEELVKLGHEITVYGVAGSITSAKLIECDRKKMGVIGLNYTADLVETDYTAQLQLVLNNMHKHDIVHVHHGTWAFHPNLMKILTNNGTKSYPLLWTDHDELREDKPMSILKMGDLGIPYTALSESHRSSVPEANNFIASIHHGLPSQLLTLKCVPQTYVAFLGRITADKNPTAAVRIATAAGYPLKVAAPVHAIDREYYENEVKPLFQASNVDYLGSIGESEKQTLLSGAAALLFPIMWREPFGLVMIEAMACGCPVIAFRNGSVSEVIDDGVTGFIVDNEEEAVQALKKIDTLNRRKVRARFEERFTATTMATKYVEIYKAVIDIHKSRQQEEGLMLSSTLCNIIQDPTPIVPQTLKQTEIKAA